MLPEPEAVQVSGSHSLRVCVCGGVCVCKGDRSVKGRLEEQYRY